MKFDKMWVLALLTDLDEVIVQVKKNILPEVVPTKQIMNMGMIFSESDFVSSEQLVKFNKAPAGMKVVDEGDDGNAILMIWPEELWPIAEFRERLQHQKHAGESDNG